MPKNSRQMPNMRMPYSRFHTRSFRCLRTPRKRSPNCGSIAILKKTALFVSAQTAKPLSMGRDRVNPSHQAATQPCMNPSGAHKKSLRRTSHQHPRVFNFTPQTSAPNSRRACMRLHTPPQGPPCVQCLIPCFEPVEIVRGATPAPSELLKAGNTDRTSASSVSQRVQVFE